MQRIGPPHRAMRIRALPRHGAGPARARAGLRRLVLATSFVLVAAVPVTAAPASLVPAAADAIALAADGTGATVGASAAASGPGAAASGPAAPATAAAVPAPAAAPVSAAPGAGTDCTRPLSLGLHEHGLLYSSQTGEGIDKDIADELIRRSGCRIKLVVMPRARIWQLLESGTLDFSLSAISNEVRDRFAAFAWYMSNKYYLLVRRDANVRSVDEFRRHAGLKVGAVRSFRYGPQANRFVDQLDDEQRVTYASGLEPLYEILIENHIQGMIIEPVDYPAIEGSQLRALTNLLEFDDPPVLHGLVMSRKSISPAQQQAWRELMMSMRADGTVRRIFEKYLPADLARTMTQF